MEYIKSYIPEHVPVKSVEMVQRAVPFKRIEYIPVTRYILSNAGKLFMEEQGLGCKVAVAAGAMGWASCLVTGCKATQWQWAITLG